MLQSNTRFSHLLKRHKKRHSKFECSIYLTYTSVGALPTAKTASYKSILLAILVSRRRTCVAKQHEVLTPTEGSQKKTLKIECLFFCGAFSRTRTYDPAVNSRMLYRLSYKGSQRDYYINILRTVCQGF